MLKLLVSMPVFRMVLTAGLQAFGVCKRFHHVASRALAYLCRIKQSKKLTGQPFVPLSASIDLDKLNIHDNIYHTK